MHWGSVWRYVIYSIITFYWKWKLVLFDNFGETPINFLKYNRTPNYKQNYSATLSYFLTKLFVKYNVYKEILTWRLINECYYFRIEKVAVTCNMYLIHICIMYVHICMKLLFFTIKIRSIVYIWTWKQMSNGRPYFKLAIFHFV